MHPRRTNEEFPASLELDRLYEERKEAITQQAANDRADSSFSSAGGRGASQETEEELKTRPVREVNLDIAQAARETVRIDQGKKDGWLDQEGNVVRDENGDPQLNPGELS